MNKLLIVSPDFPYPPNHGGRKDVWTKILIFKELGFDVDLICTSSEDIPEKDLDFVKTIVNNIEVVKRSYSLLGFLSNKPFQLTSRKALTRVALKYKYTHVILEGDYVLPFLENEEIKKCENVVYRMHNDEEIYFRELMKSEKTFLKKVYYFLESKKFRKVFESTIKHLENVWFISKDEMKRFNKKVNKSVGEFIPPHVSSNTFIKKKDFKDNRVLFVGSLFMVNNQEAILWYLKNIHKNLVDVQGYHLTIAGNSRGNSLGWLTEVIKENGYQNTVTVEDSPEDLEDLYSSHSIFINPMLHGAGVKLKTVEGIQKGLVVVSTSIGVQGTGLLDNKHVYISDSPDGFKTKLKLLLDNEKGKEKMSMNAQHYLKREFDLSEKFATILK
ncbi:glycosyltransferase family 4 protein [Priestia megaterium]|uniref:glycosyltransferase family 4 protein n=1 Tax=Priestia megaterium TaxID=1404 RepID=UPI002FFEFFAF